MEQGSNTNKEYIKENTDVVEYGHRINKFLVLRDGTMEESIRRGNCKSNPNDAHYPLLPDRNCIHEDSPYNLGKILLRRKN